MRSTNAPKTFWHRVPMACGVIRHRLWVDEQETPYFVDDATKAGIGHRTYSERVGLLGAGMGTEIKCRDGGSYRIAAVLGGFKNVSLAKARAEQLALN